MKFLYLLAVSVAQRNLFLKKMWFDTNLVVIDGCVDAVDGLRKLFVFDVCFLVIFSHDLVVCIVVDASV